MRKFPARLLGLPRTAEWIVRNVLLVGFFMLLMLVAGLGYLSWQSFRELEDEITMIRQSEVSHQSAISQISETAGKIQAYAQTALANPESKSHFLYCQTKPQNAQSRDGRANQKWAAYVFI